MKTSGVLLALLMIIVTTEAGAYGKLKRKIEDFPKNVKTLEDEVPGKPSSNKRTMDAGVSLGWSGSFGHSDLEMSKRFYPDAAFPCVPNPCQNGGRCIAPNNYQFQCICPSSFKGEFCIQANGPEVIARWTNNKYYSANILQKSNHQTTVIFTDGDKLTYSNGDVSAVLPDQAPSAVKVAHHVVAKYKGSKKYHIGFVIAESADGYDVQFDDGDDDIYSLSQLRILSNQDSPHKLGARVFARYTNGKYYRGFVDSVTSSTVHIDYDDGSTTELKMSDPSAVILDELPCYTNVDPGQRVIAHYPGRTRYYSATVKSKISRGSNACYQKDVYDVVFDDGDKTRDDFNQIRLIPS